MLFLSTIINKLPSQNMIRAATMPEVLANVVASRTLGEQHGFHQVLGPFDHSELTMILKMVLVIHLKLIVNWNKAHHMRSRLHDNNKMSSCNYKQTGTCLGHRSRS